jgi:sialic acid synthase SpsE
MNNKSRSSLRIGGRTIGQGCPTYIIAEACDNHMGDIKVAREMALRAKLAGCDAIKFQHHLADEEMLPDAPTSDNFDEPLYDFLKRCALSIDQHQSILEYCKTIDIQYLCTPFSYKAAEQLSDIGVEAIKIGSGEMSDTPTLRKITKNLELPMIVSTGMSTYEEIDHTYALLCESQLPFALMNCVSEYPPNYADLNLAVIPEMITRYPLAVIGHSDHTPDIYTSFAAIPLGAVVIEKHVILDKQQSGPDQSVSIDFFEMATLVDGIRKIEKAMGSEKIVHKREQDIRRWAFRSLVSTQPIKRGDIFSEHNIWSKRPGTGIPSSKIDIVLGRKATRDIPSNSLLAWDDIESKGL